MFAAGEFIVALLLFMVGIRLSAFFSGSETGFYRASYVRLSIDAHVGDTQAARLLWFLQNPSYFVATMLVGNNVANYLTTVAVGLVIGVVATTNSDWVEIVSTLVISPVIFILGELVPKNLYYRAPLSFLYRDVGKLVLFYRLFLVISFPLIWISKLFERFGTNNALKLELVLGRNRLVQVLNQGHREGLLTNIQSRLVNGLLHISSETAADSAIPLQRVLGVSAASTREEILDYARKYALSSVLLHQPNQPEEWFAYVRVVDLIITTQPLQALWKEMPHVAGNASKLEAMMTLRRESCSHALCMREETIVGILNERGLVEQLFEQHQTVLAEPTAA